MELSFIRGAVGCLRKNMQWLFLMLSLSFSASASANVPVTIYYVVGVNGEPRACKPGMDQVSIQVNISNGLRCALARNRINNKCFAGGDTNHRNEAINAWNTVAKCQGMAN